MSLRIWSLKISNFPKDYLKLYIQPKEIKLRLSQHTWIDVSGHVSNTSLCTEVSYSLEEISNNEMDQTTIENNHSVDCASSSNFFFSV